MELTRFENNALNQSLQQRNIDYTSTFSAPPQVKVKQSVFEKTKAELEKTVNEQDTLTAIEQANKLMELFNRDLRFETHNDTGIVQISVVDRKDGKVIKQIPPDNILNMVAMIKDILGGLMDVKA